jgi:hypothetical protein
LNFISAFLTIRKKVCAGQKYELSKEAKIRQAFSKEEESIVLEKMRSG